jgi:heterotetrameric sarcosine oxidase gamma subunit
VFQSSITTAGPSDGALRLADESAVTKMIVRAEPDSSVATHLGVVFATSRPIGDVLVVGQRPGEWQVLGPAGAVAAVIDELDVSGHVSVVDLTHGRAMIRLTGTDAPRALEKVCSIDWSDAMTPHGAAVSASVAEVTCDIVRRDRDGARSYLVSCDRSFGQYLFDALVDACTEFGVGIDA